MAPRARPRRSGEPRPAPDRAAATEIALHFLGSRPRTRWELERRLRRAGAADDVIEATLARLRELGYVDDAAFARWWLEQRDRHAPRGERLVEAELRQRGVPRDVIEGLREARLTRDAAADDGSAGSEAERARGALARHLRGRPFPTDVKAVQRIGMFLMRRGFDAETVRATLRAAADGEGEPEP